MIVALCAVLPLLCIPMTFRKKGVHASLGSLLLAALGSLACSVAALASWPQGGVLRFAQDFLVNDSLSRLFLALVSAVFTGVALYVYNRALTHPFAAKNIEGFVRSVLLFFALSALAILSNHFLLLWILLEAGTLAAVPLIQHQKGTASVRGAWRYFLFSSLGLGIAFVGLICIARGLQTDLSFDHLSTLPAGAGERAWRELGLVLLVLGFGTKLGLAPMYGWLPETYDTAPPSVTVLLAAVQFNAVILAVFRVFQFLDPLSSSLVRYELIFLGLASIFISALHIVVADNYKRLIAYASINHAGVIALGLGIGKGAAYGVVLYAISNALVKSVLFLTCGNIKARYHTKSIPALHGLIRTMPFSGSFLMIGIFALLGFAPFGSFFGEVLIMKNMIDERHFGVFALFCLITTVVFVATGRAIFPMIWGEPDREISLRGESVYTLLPNLFYVVFLLSLGIYLPGPANTLLRDIAVSVGGP